MPKCNSILWIFYFKKVVKGEVKDTIWELKGFRKSHDLLIAAHATSSVVEFENPKVVLRYYLKPSEKLTNGGERERTLKYYNLCVELLEVNSNCAVNVNAGIYIHNRKKSFKAGKNPNTIVVLLAFL